MSGWGSLSFGANGSVLLQLCYDDIISVRSSADKVALKILDKTRLDPEAQRLLSREISSMEAMEHPNVVRLYEVVETPRRLHLVLEYAGGGDLHGKICNEGKLSDSDSKIAFAQILSAIKYMVSDAGTFLLVSHHALWLSLPHGCMLSIISGSNLRTVCGRSDLAAVRSLKVQLPPL